jgi:hypothetical protein
MRTIREKAAHLKASGIAASNALFAFIYAQNA